MPDKPNYEEFADADQDCDVAEKFDERYGSYKEQKPCLEDHGSHDQIEKPYK